MLRRMTSNRQARPIASRAFSIRSAPMTATPPTRTSHAQTMTGQSRAMDVGKASFSTLPLTLLAAKKRPSETAATQNEITEITTAISNRMISPRTMVGAALNTPARPKENSATPAASVRLRVRTAAASGSTLIMRRPSALGANRNCRTIMRMRSRKNAIKSDISALFIIGGQSKIMNVPIDPMANTPSESSDSTQSVTICLRRSVNLTGD